MTVGDSCRPQVVASLFGFFVLWFPVLLSLNVDETTDVPWAVVWLPLWLYDALFLFEKTASVVQGCASRKKSDATPQPSDDSAHAAAAAKRSQQPHCDPTATGAGAPASCDSSERARRCSRGGAPGAADEEACGNKTNADEEEAADAEHSEAEHAEPSEPPLAERFARVSASRLARIHE